MYLIVHSDENGRLSVEKAKTKRETTTRVLQLAGDNVPSIEVFRGKMLDVKLETVPKATIE